MLATVLELISGGVTLAKASKMSVIWQHFTLENPTGKTATFTVRKVLVSRGDPQG